MFAPRARQLEIGSSPRVAPTLLLHARDASKHALFHKRFSKGTGLSKSKDLKMSPAKSCLSNLFGNWLVPSSRFGTSTLVQLIIIKNLLLALSSVSLWDCNSVPFPSGMSKYFLLHSNPTLPFTVEEKRKKEESPLHSAEIMNRPEYCCGRTSLRRGAGSAPHSPCGVRTTLRGMLWTPPVWWQSLQSLC